MCEEFGCLPSAAEHELDTNFERVIDVLWTRQYARAKAAYDAVASLSPEARVKLMAEPLVQLVSETDFELAAEALARKERGGG